MDWTLIVCLIMIIAIMAAIALPAFLNQRAKGEDTEAKPTIRPAIALQAHHANEDTYAATIADLRRSSRRSTRRSTCGSAAPRTPSRSGSSANRTEFTLSRSATGTPTRDCSNHGYGLCRDVADASGDFW